MNEIQLKTLQEVLDKFATQFPRYKIPSYCYASKLTIAKIKEFLRPIIKYGNPTFSGLPIYEKDIPDGEVRIFNVDDDLIRTIVLR